MWRSALSQWPSSPPCCCSRTRGRREPQRVRRPRLDQPQARKRLSRTVASSTGSTTSSRTHSWQCARP
ncbi:hypothetical protein ACFPRL_24860 [Pseudoclavibacter helvolus]